MDAAQRDLAAAAVAPFHRPEVRDYIENVRRNHEQIIDNVNLDTVLFAGYDVSQEEAAERAIKTFREFIQENRDEIMALRIIYDQRYKDRPMAIAQLKALYEKLKAKGVTEERLWDCYAIRQPDKVKQNAAVQLADLVSLIRFEMGMAETLAPFAERVNYNFQMNAVSVDGKIDTSRSITLDFVKNYIIFKNGDILFAKITPCMENGKGCIADKLKNGYGAGSTEFIVLRPKQELVTQKWLHFFLSQKSFRLHCQQHMTGSAGQKRVPTKFLANCDVPCPSLLAQERIVARIEELFSQLDASVAELKTAKERLRVYRQAVLKEAFSKYHTFTSLEQISERIFDGPFGSNLKTADYVEQGFDHYFFYSGYQGTKISMEAVEGFIYVKGESRNSWRRKEVLLRNFGMYMKDLGLEPYIPVVKTPESRTPYIPHIYTKEELRRFFNAIDEYPSPWYSSRNLVDAVLFRFLYSTGVRVSEALNLTIADYDRSAGIATILLPFLLVFQAV